MDASGMPCISVIENENVLLFDDAHVQITKYKLLSQIWITDMNSINKRKEVKSKQQKMLCYDEKLCVPDQIGVEAASLILPPIY